MPKAKVKGRVGVIFRQVGLKIGGGNMVDSGKYHPIDRLLVLEGLDRFVLTYCPQSPFASGDVLMMDGAIVGGRSERTDPDLPAQRNYQWRSV
jgi:hypothetical protein